MTTRSHLFVPSFQPLFTTAYSRCYEFFWQPLPHESLNFFVDIFIFVVSELFTGIYFRRWPSMVMLFFSQLICIQCSEIPLILWIIHLMNPNLFLSNLSSAFKSGDILILLPSSSTFRMFADLTYLSRIFMFWNSTNAWAIGNAGQSIVHCSSIPVAFMESSMTHFTSSSLLSALNPCKTALHSTGTFSCSVFHTFTVTVLWVRRVLFHGAYPRFQVGRIFLQFWCQYSSLTLRSFCLSSSHVHVILHWFLWWVLRISDLLYDYHRIFWRAPLPLCSYWICLLSFQAVLFVINRSKSDTSSVRSFSSFITLFIHFLL